MTGAPLILDADGLDALTGQPPPDRLRALLAEAWERKSDVLVPALVCAECCRGAEREPGDAAEGHGRSVAAGKPGKCASRNIGITSRQLAPRIVHACRQVCRSAARTSLPAPG
jgi:hypothetical protein